MAEPTDVQTVAVSEIADGGFFKNPPSAEDQTVVFRRIGKDFQGGIRIREAFFETPVWSCLADTPALPLELCPKGTMEACRVIGAAMRDGRIVSGVPTTGCGVPGPDYFNEMLAGIESIRKQAEAMQQGEPNA